MQRRTFLQGAAALSLTHGSLAIANSGQSEQKRPEYAAFIKFIQKLNYKQLAETVAELGFDGIEATIRDGGYITPEKAVDELPKFAEELKKCGVRITIMASSINRADDKLTVSILKAAAAAGVPRYRMKYYRYDAKKDIHQQLNELQPVIADLVAVNRELGISAVYQNHSGDSIVGAPIWDLYELFKGYKPKDIGVAFDIRHATVEGGLAWPLHYRAVQPVLGAIYVKDFKWNKTRRPVNVPLGEGRVDPRFFKILREQPYHGPISVHVEYLGDGTLKENIVALGKDLATLKKLLAS